MFSELKIRQLDFLTRFIMVASANICVFLPFFTKLKYEAGIPYEVAKVLFCVVFLIIGALYYKYTRKEQKIYSIIISTAELVFYSLLLGILSYVAAYYGLGSQEKYLSELDHIIGFNWLVHYQIVESNPVLKNVLYYSYLSLMPQYVLALAILHFFKKGEWLRIFINSFALLAIISIVTSAFLPAVEADVYFGVTKAVKNGAVWSVKDLLQAEHFLNLNNKTMTEIPLSNMQGIVSFPSFHTVAGLILVMCFSQTKWLSIPFLILNSLLIAATPSMGGHYLVDTLAGAIIALIGMAAILKFVQPGVPLFSISLPTPFNKASSLPQKI